MLCSDPIMTKRKNGEMENSQFKLSKTNIFQTASIDSQSSELASEGDLSGGHHVNTFNVPAVKNKKRKKGHEADKKLRTENIELRDALAEARTRIAEAVAEANELRLAVAAAEIRMADVMAEANELREAVAAADTRRDEAVAAAEIRMADAVAEANELREAVAVADTRRDEAVAEAKTLKDDAVVEANKVKEAAKQIVDDSTGGAPKLQKLYVCKPQSVYLGRGENINFENMIELHDVMKEFFDSSDIATPALFCGNGLSEGMVDIALNQGFPISSRVSFGRKIAEACNREPDVKSVTKKRPNGGKTDFDAADDKSLILLYVLSTGLKSVTIHGVEDMISILGDSLDKYGCKSKSKITVNQFFDRYRRGERSQIAKEMYACVIKCGVVFPRRYSSVSSQVVNEPASDSSSHSDSQTSHDS
jgi:hypothetical protein